jgi:hypothetical protein
MKLSKEQRIALSKQLDNVINFDASDVAVGGALGAGALGAGYMYAKGRKLKPTGTFGEQFGAGLSHARQQVASAIAPSAPAPLASAPAAAAAPTVAAAATPTAPLKPEETPEGRAKLLEEEKAKGKLAGVQQKVGEQQAATAASQKALEATPGYVKPQVANVASTVAKETPSVLGNFGKTAVAAEHEVLPLLGKLRLSSRLQRLVKLNSLMDEIVKL